MEPIRATGGEKSASASRVGTGHVAGRETESDCSCARLPRVGPRGPTSSRSDAPRRPAPPSPLAPPTGPHAHTHPRSISRRSLVRYFISRILSAFGNTGAMRHCNARTAAAAHRRGGRRPRGFASGSGVGAARGAVHDSVYTRTPRPAVSRGPGRPNARPRPRHGTRRSSSLSDLTSSEDSSAHRSALCAHRYRSRLTAHGSACGASESR